MRRHGRKAVAGPGMYDPKYDWIDLLQPGDLIRTGKVTEKKRIILYVNRFCFGEHAGRVYTIVFADSKNNVGYCRSDIRHFGWTPTGESVVASDPFRERPNRLLLRDRPR